MGATRAWRLGPLILWIQRLGSEWRIGRRQLEDPLDPTLEVARTVSDEEIDQAEELHRFALGGQETSVQLNPRLPDRAMVSRPTDPFHLMPGQECVVYVGLPLWVQVTLPPSDRPLVDIPVFRPSDTWFGPTTDEGELCYATRTFCRLRVEDLPFRAYRGVTAVTIRNRAGDALLLERLRLPMSVLGLYLSEEGRLWTEDVTLERRASGELARLSIGSTAPAHAHGAERIAQPRVPPQGNIMVRAFGTLLGKAQP